MSDISRKVIAAHVHNTARHFNSHPGNPSKTAQLYLFIRIPNSPYKEHFHYDPYIWHLYIARSPQLNLDNNNRRIYLGL